MNVSWYSNPAIWAYGACAAAFLWLAVRLVTRWSAGGKPAMLLAMAAATSASAVLTTVFAMRSTLGLGWGVALADFVRVGVTLGLLIAFVGVRSGQPSSRANSRSWVLLFGLAIVLLLAWLLLGVRPPGVAGPDPLTRQLGFGTALGVVVFGLMLVEQFYRGTPAPSRWHIRPLVLGLAGLFAFDVVLYSDALLFRVLDFDLWAARGFAHALTVPLILATLRRRSDWSFELSVSRGMVAGSTTLALTGAYLLFVASAGFLLRQFGGSWGRTLESVLVFAALLLMAVIGLSGTFRARVRIFVAKHFFTYRYDYREEWLRLTNTLASDPSARPWSATIRALGDLVESPGGALWFRSVEEGYRQVDRNAFPPSSESVPQDAPLPAFLRKTGWVLEVRDVLQRPVSYDGLILPPDIVAADDAWLIVPLSTGDDLAGFVVLTTPRAPVELDWEVLDLLKTAARQAAGYIAYAQATEALLEAQKFEAFHSMSTFVVHDLKNLIAQLQLLLSNAERHRDNPDFQRDMLKTIDHVATRMQQLLLQLKPEASGRDRAQPVDIGAAVRRVQAFRLGGRSGLSVDTASNVLVWAHDDLLERVIAHLVQNAFEASEGEADVRVRVEAVGAEVLVEVSDRGKGMTSEFMRNRLFKPFQTTKATGMGIGVYECRQYVEQVGGRVDIQSAPGQGTRVQIRLRAVMPVQQELGAAA